MITFLEWWSKEIAMGHACSSDLGEQTHFQQWIVFREKLLPFSYLQCSFLWTLRMWYNTCLTVLWRAVVCFRLLACRSYQMLLPLWGFWGARTGQYAVTGGPCPARRCKQRRTPEAAAAAKPTVPVRAKVGTDDIQARSPCMSMNKTNTNNDTRLKAPVLRVQMHTVFVK